MKNGNNKDINIIIIRILAFLLFFLAFLIAGGNYGFSSSLSEKGKEIFRQLYMWFEHIFRALTVLLGCFFTYRFLKSGRGKIGYNRKVTLISFSVSALVFLVIFPLATGYWEMYNALMPFPWTTLPFQLVSSGTFFQHHKPGWMGLDSVTLLLWGYGVFQVVVFTGTVIIGRRWFCSKLCLMNGCHAESLGIALPVITHNKKPQSKQIHPVVRKVLRVLQVFLFSVNMLLVLLWTVYIITGKKLPFPHTVLLRIELIKYMSLELTMLMLLWFVIGGRGYCYYCPAGFFLGIVGNLAGQRIESGLTHCTKCGACNDACKLSIDIRSRAALGQPVKALQCVGCGLCVDACPTGNLRYTTLLLTQINRKAATRKVVSGEEMAGN